MIETIDKKKLLDDFYNKEYYLSYSALNKLLYSPVVFYNHYILQDREEKVEPYLIEGKVIHCLLLDDGSFNDQFLLMPTKIPTANTKTVVDKVFQIHISSLDEKKEKLSDYNDEILDILKELDVHQRLADDKAGGKTGDEKRIEKIITEESNIYFEFLKIKDEKDVIDSEMLSNSAECVDVLRNNNDVCELLGVCADELANIEVHNEIPIQTDLLDFPFGIKGILDNVKIDYDNKVLYINDLKKTSKALSGFRDSIEYYNYWIQAAIYYRLAFSKFECAHQDNWQIKFNFIVIDKYLQVYIFEVSDDTMNQWQTDLQEKLNMVKWHYENKKFDLPYEFATGKVIL